MKKIFFAVAMCLMLAGVLTSCSSNSPEGVAEKFMENMKNENAEALVEMLELPDGLRSSSEKDKEELVELFDKKLFKSLDKKDGIKDYKVIDVDMDGDKAEVTVKTLFGNGDEEEQTIPVVKDEDGNWKILFDMQKS